MIQFSKYHSLITLIIHKDQLQIFFKHKTNSSRWIHSHQKITSMVLYGFMMISGKASTQNCLTSEVKYRNRPFLCKSYSTTAHLLHWFPSKSKFRCKIVKSLSCSIGCHFQVLRICRTTFQLKVLCILLVKVFKLAINQLYQLV